MQSDHQEIDDYTKQSIPIRQSALPQLECQHRFTSPYVHMYFQVYVLTVFTEMFSGLFCMVSGHLHYKRLIFAFLNQRVPCIWEAGFQCDEDFLL